MKGREGLSAAPAPGLIADYAVSHIAIPKLGKRLRFTAFWALAYRFMAVTVRGLNLKVVGSVEDDVVPLERK